MEDLCERKPGRGSGGPCHTAENLGPFSSPLMCGLECVTKVGNGVTYETVTNQGVTTVTNCWCHHKMNTIEEAAAEDDVTTCYFRLPNCYRTVSVHKYPEID